ncbi:probable ATP-dependent RNA helicase DDX43 isoform X2 [Ctenocephalides felis]|uniref:probable ATP-dependent RNA helicase DDX43 isoform X2 n=1 Tax=Ctenocephalides felis TaxID=7515 RepID=UPI000E6E1107|nr:probable ATP-dependent RNA helicase DDX43 isoform X2 [Ctenocephalides felis]
MGSVSNCKENWRNDNWQQRQRSSQFDTGSIQDHEENWDDEDCSQQQQLSQHRELPRPVSSFNNRPAYSTSFQSKPSGSSHSNRHSNRSSISRGHKDNDKIIKIPSKKLGRLIGRGGCNIQNIRKSSQCMIKTEIILIGSKSNQERAEALINELLFDHDSKKSTETIDHVTEELAEVSIEENNRTDDDEFPDWAALIAKSKKYTEEKWAKFPPVIKNFYVEHPEVTQLSPEEVEDIFKANNVTVSFLEAKDECCAEPIPNPIQTFAQCFNQFPEMLQQIERQGFQKPSPIQAHSWPILLSGKDMIGISQTGSGKTLAFILPALVHLHGQSVKSNEPSVLVLAPTRELALQIESEVLKYPYKETKVLCVYGGVNRKEQRDCLTQGAHIIVATPGRLNDFLESKDINIEGVTYLVLDEADRMLDLGFEPQIRKILSYLRPQRQTVMTSATWPYAISDLAQHYMANPVLVRVGSLDLTPVASVTQEIVLLQEDEKIDAVITFLKTLKDNEKAIIFCGKKATVDMISCDIQLEGIRCDSIHGGREQYDRVRALDDIKSGAISILIATDVASRGIDIKDITHILNYDFPHTIEEYVHRVGRTGRAGKTGKSITYVTRNDWKLAKDLRKILQDTNQVVPEEINRMCDAYEQFCRRRQLSGRR